MFKEVILNIDRKNVSIHAPLNGVEGYLGSRSDFASLFGVVIPDDVFAVNMEPDRDLYHVAKGNGNVVDHTDDPAAIPVINDLYTNLETILITAAAIEAQKAAVLEAEMEALAVEKEAASAAALENKVVAVLQKYGLLP